MATDHIRYDVLARDALRGVLRRVLTDAAEHGLPGEHHFFITFLSTADDVKLSPRLLAQYPEEMTVILQHQFWDLTVTEDRFEVGLSSISPGAPPWHTPRRRHLRTTAAAAIRLAATIPRMAESSGRRQQSRQTAPTRTTSGSVGAAYTCGLQSSRLLRVRRTLPLRTTDAPVRRKT